MKLSELVEIEERVGQFWHRLVGQQASWPGFPAAAVRLSDLQKPLSVFFRAMGGDPGLSLVTSASQESKHRLSFRQRIGMDGERLARPMRDEQSLALPERIDHFPDASLNRDLYFWLAAYFTVLKSCDHAIADPLQSDIDFLHRAASASRAALMRFPGLVKRYQRIAAALLELRPRRKLRGFEKRVEEIVLALLHDPSARIDNLVVGKAPAGYRSFLPVPIWGEAVFRKPLAQEGDEDESDGEKGGDKQTESDKRYQARREETKDADGKDGLILNRFEKILSMAEMMAVNRSADDADEEEAKKAADDLEYLSLGKHWKKPASKLKLDLDLTPAAADDGALDGDHLYPEWDCRLNAYRSDYCRVVTGSAPLVGESWQADETLHRRIKQVRRQFEALVARPQLLKAQPDGSDLDTDALVRAATELKACGLGSERIYIQHRKQERDLGVLVLVDASLSTDAWIENRRVLDVEKEALTVLSHALEACGDSFSILTFSSKRRKMIRIETVKDFEEPFSQETVQKIGAIKPGYYTRIGSAVRHGTTLLDKRPNRHRLMLLITDGKPNDIDHYEGRYALDDTRKAVLEARRQGHKVFGVTVDRKAQDYFPYLFGKGSYAIVGHLGHLTTALPRLYRHLVAA